MNGIFCKLLMNYGFGEAYFEYFESCKCKSCKSCQTECKLYALSVRRVESHMH